jgi:hypothetical protein
MTATTGTTELWRSPSGRLHHQRHCSGGSGYRNVKVRMPDRELAALELVKVGPLAPHICRCAQGVRDKARARLAEGS